MGHIPHAWERTVLGPQAVAVEVEAQGEPVEPVELNYMPTPESVPDTSFKDSADEVCAAEAIVLAGLAERIAVLGLSPWEAADALFNRAGMPPEAV